MTFLEAVRPMGLPDVPRRIGAYVETLKSVARARELRLFWIVVMVLPVIPALLDASARVLRRAGYLTRDQSEIFSVSEDLGFVEISGLGFFLVAAILIFAAARLLRDRRLTLWAWFIYYIIFDETFMIHDQLRAAAGKYFFPQLKSLAADGIAEILFFGTVLLFASTAILVIYRRAPARSLLTAATMAAPFCLFLSFSFLLDGTSSSLLVGGLISEFTYRILLIIEECGELLATGLIFMAAMLLYRLGRNGSQVAALH